MSKAWMPLYWGDYYADTGHLRTVEHGAYLLLIGHYWCNGSLPDDDRKLARITKMRIEDWKRIRPTVGAFFGNGWRHARIEAELGRLAEITNKRKQAAVHMHSKRRANASGLHDGLHTQSQSQSPTKKVTVTVSKPESGGPVRSGSNGPRTGTAQIGERIGDYFWDGLKWAEIPEADQPCPF
jgi:uncharacterized protein YdaU (DUF1376 family)